MIIALAVFLPIAGFAVYMAAWISSNRARFGEAASEGATVLYTLIQRQEYDKAVEQGYLFPDDRSTLVMQDAKFGRVLSFRIHRVSHGPFGLPVAVRLDVQRERGTTREVAMKYGSRGHRLQVVMSDKGIL